MQKNNLDQLDLQLIHALQISPRVPWKSLANILGKNETTLARRWQVLLETGMVWTSAYRLDLQRLRGAVVELDILPGKLPEVIEHLNTKPATFTIDIISSGTSLVVTVSERDQSNLVEFLLRDLHSIGHIHKVTNHLITEYIRSADAWTVRVLDPAVAAKIPPTRFLKEVQTRALPPDIEGKIIQELGLDARVSVANIARATKLSHQRAQDALSTIFQQSNFRLRTDISARNSNWPIQVWYFLDVPAEQLETFSKIVSNLPEVRGSMKSAGNGNLMLIVWLRSLSSIHHFEEAMQRTARGNLKIRREVILRTVKRSGHILDHMERNTGKFVPPPFV